MAQPTPGQQHPNYSSTTNHNTGGTSSSELRGEPKHHTTNEQCQRRETHGNSIVSLHCCHRLCPRAAANSIYTKTSNTRHQNTHPRVAGVILSDGVVTHEPRGALAHVVGVHDLQQQGGVFNVRFKPRFLSTSFQRWQRARQREHCTKSTPHVEVRRGLRRSPRKQFFRA